MVEPTLSRLDVVRYADSSGGAYLTELDMLNHSSVFSSAPPRDRDLDLSFVMVLLCSINTQLAVPEWEVVVVTLLVMVRDV